MTVRTLVLTSLLTLAALPAAAQVSEYAPGTTRYVVSTSSKGSQLSPMGNNEFELGVRQVITVNLVKQAKDTLAATVTLDSISLTGAAAAADVSTLNGAKFLSWVSPTGKLYSARAPEGANPALAQVTEGISRFLPAFRANLKAGATWTDTTSGKVTQQGMEVDRTIVSTYTVGADTSIGGTRAHRIGRVTAVKAAGSGTAQGTPLKMESASNSQGTFYLSTKGVYLGGVSNDEVTVKLTIPSQGADITMKQNGRTTIEPIR